MTRYRRYKKAFKIACELLNGNFLFGYDIDSIFEEIMKKDGVVSSDSYEEFILKNLKKLSCGKAEVENNGSN